MNHRIGIRINYNGGRLAAGSRRLFYDIAPTRIPESCFCRQIRNAIDKKVKKE